MKKIIYCLIVLQCLVACQEAYQIKIDIPTSGIGLELPANGENINLDDLAKVEHDFVWDKASANGSVLIFSLTKDLIESVSMDAGDSTCIRLHSNDLNIVLSQLGTKSGEYGDLYWTVKSKDNLTAAASELYSLSVKRITSLFHTPEDMSSLALLADAPETTVLFEWNLPNEENNDNFSVVFSTDSKMTNYVTVDKKGKNNLNLSHEELQQTIETLEGFKRYSTNTIYWNVLDNNSKKLLSIASNQLKLSDMMRFVDIRGDEKITYKVTRIHFSDGSSQVWLAENLRTRCDQNGELIDEFHIKSPPEDLDEDWKEAFGYYYSFWLRDKYIPSGWRLPAVSDWKNLVDEAKATGNANVIKHERYFYKDTSGQEHLNEWGIGLTSTGAYVNGTGLPQNIAHETLPKFYCSVAHELGDHRVLVFDSFDNLWGVPPGGASWGAWTPQRYIYIEN